MRSKSLIVLLAVAALAFGVFAASAQGPDDEVRGAFLSTRPKTTNTNAPTRRRRTPRPANSNSVGTKNTNSSSVNSNTTAPGNSRPSGNNLKALGLGYTLFMRGANGRSVRVEPDREFRAGDRVRIALEPNVDGYLYIFHAEGVGAPEMIYPDSRLDDGNNWIEAHVPMEVPSSEEADERLRWFTFDANPANEHLYVVITREPLQSVPAGSDLVTLCTTSKDKCPWHPSAEVWAQVQDATKAEVKVVTSKVFGVPQSEKEKIATTRGLGLDKTAPQPAVIRMNASTNSALLVAVLDLIHK